MSETSISFILFATGYICTTLFGILHFVSILLGESDPASGFIFWLLLVSIVVMNVGGINIKKMIE